MKTTNLARSFFVAVLSLPAIAAAQPVDDPGAPPAPPPPAAPKAEPAPPPAKAEPPAPKPVVAVPAPAPAPAPAAKPAPPVTPAPKTVHFVPPPPLAPPPEITETVETQVRWTDEVRPTSVEANVNDRIAAPSLAGPVGLYRTLTGDVGPGNGFRVGLHFGGFKQDSFLVAPNSTYKGDSNSRVLGDLTIGYTPWKYLETYFTLQSASNQNTRTDPGRTDPEVILALGDLSLGLKGRIPVAKFWDIGLHAGVRFLSSATGVSFNGDSTNFAADLISTWDLRRAVATRNVPLRFHLNFGFLVDQSAALLPAGQCSSSTSNDPCIRSRVVESFGYGIGSDRFRLALAFDAPVVVRSVGVAPFFEYHADIAVGDGDLTLRKALASSVSKDRLMGPAAQWLTLGLRVRPVAGLVVDAGLDVGLASPGFAYGSPVPSWALMGGLAYAYDWVGRTQKTKVVETKVTREIARGAAVGRIRGIVRDATTRKPLGGVIVRYTNRRESPQVSADDGGWLSYGFTPGRVSIEVLRDDYNPVVLESAANANTETPIEVLLTPKPPMAGQVRGHATDPAGLPVASTVRFTSAAGAIVDGDIEGGGTFTAKLPPGDYAMQVAADGFLAKQKELTIQPAQVQTVDVVLTKKPATPHVALTSNEITVKGVVHFGTSDAVIKLDGEQLLDEVVDVLLRNPQVRRVRVEGHTDNRGNADQNLVLSRNRAQAVVAYLVKQGVSPQRLEAEGFGAGQPLVPNVTPANRNRNRRVAFKILE
jgi:outer membrane protein OmpA-like peptidoglycan-associated protein